MTTAWEGPCPKCVYVRTPSDRNPEWQCPRCHIAYAKYRPGAAPIARFAAEGREMAAEARSDLSLLALIAANVVALAVAYAAGMTLHELMLVYWIQSVVIGVYSALRIVNLEESSAHKAALFFLGHYGFFHAAYFAYLVFDGESTLGSPGAYLLCALVFVINHGYSFVHNIRSDVKGRPDIVVLMFLPYARVAPMNFLLALGAHVSGGTGAFLLFGVLKILADAVMHTVEHHVLANKGKIPPWVF